jgi:peptide/nickel transport system permease protein
VSDARGSRPGRPGRTLRNRGIRLVTTVLAVSLLTFLLTSLLPGDPANAILGAEGITPEAVARVHRDLRLDDPLPVRFFRWLGDVLHGDLGQSYTLGRPVRSLIAQRLPVTLELIVLSMTIALLVSIPLGVWTAYRAKHAEAKAISLLTYVLLAVPSFVVGIMLILLFAIELDWLPASGWVAFSESPLENLRSALLPALSLALPQIAVFTRLLRGDMVATLDQDFVAFADSKGLSLRRILLGHAFRPSSFSLLTLAGTSVGYLLGGTVIIETMYNLPGMGTLLVNAILQRDLTTVQGVTLFVAIAFVLVNFVVDALYSVVDPRIRRAHGVAAI